MEKHEIKLENKEKNSKTKKSYKKEILTGKIWKRGRKIALEREDII